ncbi:PEP-CTERM sorting domain-containing protein [Thalassotalea sp. HSM 43]|uniref:PEP-CTERM sorting domain-containing protein n=1 Tax=Thalassotalea sp. HSM 43 TaxID=2552945 RepID=UPI001E650DE7|nr:PEP-CTERM sorting domain-containing protein [Thalassotalea sp. HSM 43]
MKKLIYAFLACLGLTISSTASAGFLNFMELGETEGGALELVYEMDGYTLTITGFDDLDDDDDVYAYLDAPNNTGPGGLGVCADVDDAMQCVPSSNDNVTEAEYLVFTFSGLDEGTKVGLQQLWFNNYHDGNLGVGDLINVDFSDIGGPSVDFEPVTDGMELDPGNWAWVNDDPSMFLFGEGDSFTISYVNQTFYVSGFAASSLDVPAEVPEPSNLVLLALGLVGLAATRRRRQ